MRRSTIGMVLLAALLAAASCSSSSTTATGTGPSGTQDYTLRVNLTDMPMMGLAAVNVTVASVRIHQSATAASNAAGWQEIPVTAAMPVDLMQYRNGAVYELCRVNLPAGSYQQVQLQLTPNAGTMATYHNSVMTQDGAIHPIDVPSDSIKIVHSFTVATGSKTDLVMDFNAAQSCRQRGNGTWFMNPVISASSSMM
jgi:hypothetical protein